MIGPFEAINTFQESLAKNLIEFLEKYDLRKKIIAYVKNEGFNFNTMTIALKLVVSCDILSLEDFFHITCFGHAFLEAC
jgi:hypothetical protein